VAEAKNKIRRIEASTCLKGLEHHTSSKCLLERGEESKLGDCGVTQEGDQLAIRRDAPTTFRD